jgi:hypothetical protein
MTWRACPAIVAVFLTGPTGEKASYHEQISRIRLLSMLVSTAGEAALENTNAGVPAYDLPEEGSPLA